MGDDTLERSRRVVGDEWSRGSRGRTGAGLLDRLLTWLAEHDALLLFLSVLVEEEGVPLPVPSDVAVLVAAHRAARGEMSLLSVFLIVQGATLIGASVLYWAGRRAGRPLLYRYGGILHLDQARLAKVERMVTQHGALAVIGGRLVPGLRIVNPLASGVFGVPYRQFLPALAVASSVYLAVVIAVGVVGGPALLEALKTGILPVRFVVTTLLLGGGGVLPGTPLAPGAGAPHSRASPGREQAPFARGSAAGRPGGQRRDGAGRVLAAGPAGPAGDSRRRSEPCWKPCSGGGRPSLARHLPLPAAAPGAEHPRVAGGPGGAAAVAGGGAGAVGGALAALAEPRLRGSAGVRGLGFALVPWLTSGLLYLPLIGAGPFGLALGAGWLPILGEAVRCAIFGISLGVLYRLVRLAPQPRKPRLAARVPPARGAHAGPRAVRGPASRPRPGPAPSPPDDLVWAAHLSSLPLVQHFRSGGTIRRLPSGRRWRLVGGRGRAGVAPGRGG